MNKIIIIAKWEYLEKIKTKLFIISLIITPLIIMLFSILPTLLVDKESLRTKLIGVVDDSEIYFNRLSFELEKYKIDDARPYYIFLNLTDKSKSINNIKAEADSSVMLNRFEGYLLISQGNTDSASVQYRSDRIGSFRDIRRFEDVIHKIRIQNNLSAKGIDMELADMVQEEGKQNFMIVFFSAFIFILLLMMMVIYSGQMLVRSLIEEKSNRLIEILISSCTSEELLAGKIIGLSALGLTQILIWSLIGIGLVGSAIIPTDAFQNILPMLLYFVIGFIFYTTIFVGIGAVVSTEQEAQQITTFISLILVLPVVIAVPAIQNPGSVMVKFLSFIPFTIPSIMLLRFKIEVVPLTDILITLAIMFVSIIITLKLSAKIFRIGILSYGKRPSPKELIRWLKEKN
jgi:ABC-2 type transport system permease protein